MALRRIISSSAQEDDLFLSVSTRQPGLTAAAEARKSRGPVLAGRVTLHARGFGFVQGADGQSYYVPASLARFLLTGDRVSFTAAMGAGGREVRLVTHVARDAGRLLCEARVSAQGGLTLLPDEACSRELVCLDPLGPEIEPGDVLSVRYGAYEGLVTAGPLEVSFERNLGPRGRPDFDLDYALLRYGFETPLPEFDLSALASCDAPAVEAQAWSSFERVPFVTIDAESTRDIDDAVFASSHPSGGWMVQVAIADVAWYVAAGSELDSWAAQRVTSLYLPGRTLSMLPDALSCNRCSLLPGQVRRAVVMTLELDAEGRVLSSHLDRARVESVARLTYAQVAAFMAGEPNMRFAGQVEQNLQALADVYQVLTARRQAQGRLDFDEPEPTMVQDEQGRWVLSWERRTEAHKLIEELMLLANRTAADMLVQRYGAGLFRHQPAPTQEHWSGLQAWARDRAHELPEQPNLRAMADLVAAQPNSEAQLAASLKVRSAMQPARYAVQQRHEGSGHFSLNTDWYTHFTSPIRRYADLLVHRLLLAPAEFTLKQADWDALAQQVQHCSERSQAARLAERFVWDRLKLQGFMAATTQHEMVSARVMRGTAHGLRVLLSGGQCSAWLPAEVLREHGGQWVSSQWSLPEGSATRILSEGASLSVVWTRLVLDRPAYPELLVRPAVAKDVSSTEGSA